MEAASKSGMAGTGEENEPDGKAIAAIIRPRARIENKIRATLRFDPIGNATGSSPFLGFSDFRLRRAGANQSSQGDLTLVIGNPVCNPWVLNPLDDNKSIGRNAKHQFVW